MFSPEASENTLLLFLPFILLSPFASDVAASPRWMAFPGSINSL